MKICFTRDSVCMADDCFDNSRKYTIKDDANLDEIMPLIKENRFLASVSGNDVVWVLKNTKDEEILSYFTLEDKVIKRTEKESIQEICDGVNELHFKYYCSRRKRAEYIEKHHGNSPCDMWHDDWIEEYNLCI